MTKFVKSCALMLSLVASTVFASGSDNPASDQAKAEAKAKAFDLRQDCGTPGYPKTALSLGLEGTASVKMTVNPQGKLSDIAIVRSSGWRMLDAELMEHLQKCTMASPPAQPLTVAIRYKWLLESDKERRGYKGPKLVAESCPKSDLLHLADDNESGVGIVIGVIVGSDAGVKAAFVEWDHSAELDQEALRVAKLCQFTAGHRRGRTFDGGIGLRFLPNASAANVMPQATNAVKSQP